MCLLPSSSLEAHAQPTCLMNLALSIAYVTTEIVIELPSLRSCCKVVDAWILDFQLETGAILVPRGSDC